MKEFRVELVIRESTSTLVSFDIMVKAKSKKEARKLATDYSRAKGYNLITMAIEKGAK